MAVQYVELLCLVRHLAPSIMSQAPLKMVAANWRLAGEDVVRVDFSEVRRPGHYHMYVPGLGISDTFVISDAALDYAACV